MVTLTFAKRFLEILRPNDWTIRCKTNATSPKIKLRPDIGLFYKTL